MYRAYLSFCSFDWSENKLFYFKAWATQLQKNDETSVVPRHSTTVSLSPRKKRPTRRAAESIKRKIWYVGVRHAWATTRSFASSSLKLSIQYTLPTKLCDNTKEKRKTRALSSNFQVNRKNSFSSAEEGEKSIMRSNGKKRRAPQDAFQSSSLPPLAAAVQKFMVEVLTGLLFIVVARTDKPWALSYHFFSSESLEASISPLEKWLSLPPCP